MASVSLRAFSNLFRTSKFYFTVLFLVAPRAALPAEHPLDPLSKDEITITVEVLRTNAKVADKSILLDAELHEPPKDEVLAYRAGADFRREAFVIVYDPAQMQLHEATVDLKRKSLLSWKLIPGAGPRQTGDEGLRLVPEAVRADKRWQEAMRRRGISDFSKVFVEYVPAGYFGHPDEAGRRVGRAFSFYRGDAVNFYARPIEGVVALVDLASGQVLRITDTGVVPVSRENGDLDPMSIGKQRPAPKPLLSSQPEGANFEVTGHAVRWQNWRFRFGFTPREGMVLYDVGYEQDGRVRSILYRGSLSELKMIYADPSPDWYFFNPFDEGEVGIGVFAGPLQPGADVPVNAFFSDVAFVSETGDISEIPRAMALYERDGGILWKHNEFDGGKNETRRSRELVLTSISSIGNYDYGFNWIFHQDGVLEMEVQLTGIMEPQGIDPAVPPGQMMKHAQRVSRDIAAVDHQHFFNFRLDMDVDGAEDNSVVEMNVEALPASEAKPYGRAFTVTETPLRTEQEAKRQLNFASNRSWKIINSGSKNGLGGPTGYMLMTGENSVPHIAPESFVRKGSGFINQHLWVTPYDPAQRYATGSYPYGRKESDGLPEWTSANRSINRKDVVVWYTMGITHVPRPEEWPVMNVHTAGFRLVPAGFFDRNPALDVPPEAAK